MYKLKKIIINFNKHEKSTSHWHAFSGVLNVSSIGLAFSVTCKNFWDKNIDQKIYQVIPTHEHLKYLEE